LLIVPGPTGLDRARILSTLAAVRNSFYERTLRRRRVPEHHRDPCSQEALRAAVTGSTVSPPIFEVMELLGRDEICGRIGDLSGPMA